MDDLSGVAAFVRTAQARSFAKAARQLGVTASRVSKAMARPEARLGVRLLNRTTRSVSLTPDGAAFFERCRQALADIEEAEAALSLARAAARSAQDRSAVEPGPAVRRAGVARVRGPLSGARDRGVAHRPPGRRRRGGLRRGGAHQRAARPGLVARRIAQTSLLVCASPAYLDVRGAPRTPEDLPRHACVAFLYPHDGRPFDWRFRTPGSGEALAVPVGGTLKVNNGDALVEAAVAGAGLVQVNDFLARRAIADGRLRPVLPDWLAEELPIHVLYPQNRHLSPKVRAFVDFLVDLAPSLAAPIT